MLKRSIGWYFRQLFPLQYVSFFYAAGVPTVTVWKMWFGQVYQMKTRQVIEQ